MSLVIFRAVLPDGYEVIGPIQGCGGTLGAGILDHCVAGERTLKRVQAAILCAEQGRPSLLPEPEPGKVIMYPHYSAKSDGPAVFIPLAQSRITVYEVRP